MKSMRVIVVFLGLILGLGNCAFAETSLGKLTRRDNSVTKVMLKAGCSLGWLSQVVADSGINPTKLRHLDVGQKVVIGGSCKGEAPASVHNLSNMLMKVDMAGSRGPDLQPEVARLKGELGATSTRLASVLAERDRLKSQVGKLEAELSIARRPKPEVPAKAAAGPSYRVFGLSILVALALGGTVAYFWLSHLARNEVSFPASWKLREDGKEYEFTLVGAAEGVPGSGNIIGRYKCPMCPEKNLFGRDRNLRGHVREKHATERVVVNVDPQLHHQADAS